jgi:ribosomal protein L31E
MATERTYIIPLRKEWLKTVKYRRAKKAVRAIREFLMRHMKAAMMEDVRLGKYLNLELWKHSIKRPPSRVKVNVTKDDKGIVRAELFGAPKEEKKVEAPKKTVAKKDAAAEGKPAERKEAPAEKKDSAPAEKKAPTPVPEKKAEPAKEAPKPAEKKPAAPKPAAPAPAPKPAAPAPHKQIGQIIR